MSGEKQQETGFTELPTVESPPAYNNIYPATPSSPIPAKDSPLVQTSGHKLDWKKVAVISASVLVGVIIIAVLVVVLVDDNPDPGSTTTPVMTTPGPGWTQWSEWSDCDATCGLGTKYRTRECVPEGKDCVGSDSQVTSCYVEACPRPEYGIWTTWSAWSTCSVSCDGGGQSRNRTCEKPSETAEDCVGSDSQSRICEIWDCPSCSRTCPDSGNPEQPECVRCICPGQEFNGMVTSSTNLPLSDATVVDSVVPSYVLVTTGEDGDFKITDACRFTKYLIRAPGHADVYYDLTSVGPTVQTITLQRIARLQIAQHPQGKIRRSGESVTFCCSASGNPPPDYYEWFYDNLLINPLKYNYSNELTLSELTTENTGQYKCRASNDYSAVYSTDVLLRVIDESGSSCTEVPDPYVIDLPKGCKNEEGESRFDVGQCNGATCRGDNETDSGQCRELSLYCCSPVSYKSFFAQCNGYQMKVYHIEKCGCAKCSEPYIQIQGKVLDAGSKEPIPYVTVTANDTELGVSGSDGVFSFAIPPGTLDIVLRFTELYSQYVETTRQLTFPEGFLGIFPVNVQMILKAPEISMSSSDDNLLDIGSDKGAPFAQVFIPANRIYKGDGTFHSGNVRVSININDPRNVSDFLNLPSQLTYIDDGGNTQRLQSFGMFSMNLLSDNDEILQVRGKVQLAIDLSIFGPNRFKNANNYPKLWSLDPKLGQWVYQAEMVLENETYPAWRKSNFANAGVLNVVAIGETEIPIDYIYTNFDSYPERACHSKVRIFNHNNPETRQEISKASIKVISRTDGGETFEMSELQSRDPQPKGGFCMIHTCDILNEDYKGYNGFMVVEAFSSNPNEPERFYAAEFSELNWDDTLKDRLDYKRIDDEGNHAAELKFDATINVDRGPFYHWDGDEDDLKKWAYSKKCAEAEESDPHILFYGYDFNDDGCTENEYAVEEVHPDQDPDQNFLAWFAKSLEKIYEVCYIKVLISGGEGIEVTASSHVGNNTQPELDIYPGLWYGQSYECPKSNNPENLCLEIKRSGIVTNGKQDEITAEDETLIKVFPTDANGDMLAGCTLEEVRSCLINSYGKKITNMDGPFEMYTEAADYGQTFGIYCSSSDHPETVRNDARWKCENAPNTGDCTGDNDKEGSRWALKFKCG